MKNLKFIIFGTFLVVITKSEGSIWDRANEAANQAIARCQNVCKDKPQPSCFNECLQKK